VRELIANASAAARCAAADRFVRSFPPSTEIAVLANTRGAADDFVRRVVLGGNAAFGLHRFSLVQFASRLARHSLADEGRVALTRLAQEAMSANAAFKVLQEGGLPYFEPVAAFPGFARSVAASIAELRLARVPVSELSAAGVSARDVARLLEAFDEQLVTQGASDLADLYSLATDAAAEADAPLRDAPLVLLDVAIRNASESGFVRSLVTNRTAVFATALAADRETIEVLTSIGFTQVPAATAPQHTSLDRLRTNLFSGTAEDGAEDLTVVFSSAPGEAREAVELARRIHAEARRGVPYDDIAVLLRSPAQYMAHVETALRRAGIPYFPARSVARPDPAGRAYLALLACAAEDYSAKRFAEYISLGQVPREHGAIAEEWVPPEDDILYVPTSEEPAEDADDEPTESEPLRAPWRWEDLLVEAAVIGGADRWERRLRGLAEEFLLHRARLLRDEPESARIEAIDNDLARLRELALFAMPIIRRLEAMQACATWAEWLVALRTLATAALRKPRRVLRVLAELEPMGSVGPVTILDVQGLLSERLLAVPRRQPADRYGRVFVGALDDARGRLFRVVLVPGLAERGFPKAQREDPLLLDATRRRISTKLPLLDDWVADERLLLQTAVGAATERIAFSYPRVEIAEARARVPSFYALDVARAVTGKIPSPVAMERAAREVTKARLPWPAPEDPSTAIDAAEHDLAILLPHLRSSAGEAEGRAQYLLSLNDALGRSMRSRVMRWANRTWSSADGFVRPGKDVQALLPPFSLKARAYSASSLQLYARCPYLFFLGTVQKLRPRMTIEPVERLDPMTRGTLVHAIYAGIAAELRSRNMLPLTDEVFDAARAIADMTIDTIAAAYHDRLAPAIERVWRDQIDAIRVDSYHWIRNLIADGPSWTPRYFELSFGLAPLDDAEPGSVAEAVTLKEGWILHGSIDLVEEHRAKRHLRVTDYKTGGDPVPATLIVGHGETLQPLIYAGVAETILKKPVTETRLYYATTRGGFASRYVALNALSRIRLDTVLAEIDDAILAPRLLPIPRTDGCNGCDFLSVCGPYEEERARQYKNQEMAEHVDAIRGLA
jgi:ATP-dependent helicase/nuclease subunit B